MPSRGTFAKGRSWAFRRPRDAKDNPDWEEVMQTLVGFGTFAALVEEQISEKISRRILSGDQGMVVWWSIEAGVHVEPYSHTNEQIVWMLKGKMDPKGCPARCRRSWHRQPRSIPALPWRRTRVRCRIGCERERPVG
jgi:hypothetical protein